jgi:hypothetical protein
MEAFNFTVANEDCCLYTYDMRALKSAACVHKVGRRVVARCAPATCARAHTTPRASIVAPPLKNTPLTHTHTRHHTHCRTLCLP